MKKAFFTLAVALLAATGAWAQTTFTVNNLKYTVTDAATHTVELTGYESALAGEVNIPATVTNGGTTYSVTSIGDEAFNLCNALTEVTISDGVISIGLHAFSFCTALTKVTIPNSVTTIVHHAFQNCEALTEIIFGNGLTTIEQTAFYCCSSLQQVTIPASVTSIGYSVFGNCHALTQINVESDNTSYCSENGVLFSHDKTRLVQYPAGKPETSYIIPEGVATITNGAFESCKKLMTVSIPSSMTTIEERAFLYCSSLTEMTVLATTPPTLGTGAFQNVSRTIPVYVPATSLATYQAAEVWSEFTNLQAIGTSGVPAAAMPESIRMQGCTLHNPQGLHLTLYDMQGRQVYSGNDATLSQPAGVYVVRCAGASCKVVF